MKIDVFVMRMPSSGGNRMISSAFAACPKCGRVVSVVYRKGGRRFHLTPHRTSDAQCLVNYNPEVHAAIAASVARDVDVAAAVRGFLKGARSQREAQRAFAAVNGALCSVVCRLAAEKALDSPALAAASSLPESRVCEVVNCTADGVTVAELFALARGLRLAPSSVVQRIASAMKAARSSEGGRVGREAS